ncbi:tetratricopeptide repeat protein [Sorangium sp. So ce861]|uniref:tetratricopeptide repeat protein n=1 Tax=Sorangium sp. So ce861 TaxID=3133323 RepID=UPI003F5EE31E
MKIIQDDTTGHLSAFERRQRIEARISLWKQSSWRGWRRSNCGSDPPFEDQAERNAWLRFLALAEGVPPASHVDGLRWIIESHNVDNPDDPWSADELERAELVRRIGPRVSRAIFGKKRFRLAHGHSWTLLLRKRGEEDIERMHRACMKRMKTVHLSSDHLLAAEPKIYEPVLETAHLVSLALELPALDIPRVWSKARALEVEDGFFEHLPHALRRELTGRLARILEESAEWMRWTTDLELELFADGKCEQRKYSEPIPLRFSEFVQGERALAKSHKPLCSDYFADIASALILVGDASEIANTMNRLPPGRALFAAVGAMREQRPELLARFIWHPEWCNEGLFGIHRLPAQVRVPHRGITIDLRDEWDEVQTDARWLVMFPDHSTNLGAALALAIRDEEADACPDTSDRSIRSLAPSVRMAPWEKWLERPENAENIAQHLGELLKDLRIGAGGSGIIVALRLLGVVMSLGRTTARAMAVHIADAYSQRMSLLASVDLRDHGSLLANVAKELRASGDKARLSLWLCPFSIDVIRAHMASGDEEQVWRFGKNIVLHVEHLIAQAEFLDLHMSHDVASAIVNTIEHTHHKGISEPWSWMHLDHLSPRPGLPLFARFGRLLARGGKDAEPLVKRLLQANLSSLQLAQIAWGIGSDPTLSPLVTPWLPSSAQALGEDGYVTWGHYKDTIVALFYAGRFEDVGRIAGSFLDDFDRETRDDVLRPYRDTVVQARLAALLSLGCYKDVADSDMEVHDRDAKVQAENIRSIALVEDGRTEEAIEVIERILRSHPRDPMARTNLAACFLKKRDWKNCLKAVADARSALDAEAPAELLESEAIAKFNLGDMDGAVRALDAMPRHIARSSAIVELRVNMMLTTSPVLSAIREDLEALERSDPSKAVELRAKLSPFSNVELAGGMLYPGGTRARLTFEDRCVREQNDPTELLVKHLASACHGLAQHPSLCMALSEDELTQILCIFMVGLKRFRVYSKPLVQGGRGPKKEGIADFAILDESHGEFADSRILVKGEAKIWDGVTWIEHGIRQVFGVANTGAELFVALVVYVKEGNFSDCVEKTRIALQGFGGGSEPFRTSGDVKVVNVGYGAAVSVSCSTHATSNPADRRTLYTFLVDILSKDSQRIRAQGARSKPKAAAKRKPSTAQSQAPARKKSTRARR